MWKRKRIPEIPARTTPTDFPIGTFVYSERGYFYILNATKRYRIISNRVLESWNPPRVVLATEDALVNYKIGAKLKFRNGSLIRNVADGRIYLIEGGKRRHIVSPDAFNVIGVDYSLIDNYVTPVSDEETLLHEEGKALT